MDELIAKYITGNASAQERRKVGELRAADPAFARELSLSLAALSLADLSLPAEDPGMTEIPPFIPSAGETAPEC